ncbi:hypothetical protein D3C72_2520690 [compost metagenome]
MTEVASATRRAAAWASSFGLPTTKFSKVKRGSSGAEMSVRSSSTEATAVGDSSDAKEGGPAE